MDIKKIAQIEIAVLSEAVNRLEKLKDEYNKETAYGIVLAILVYNPPSL